MEPDSSQPEWDLFDVPPAVSYTYHEDGGEPVEVEISFPEALRLHDFPDAAEHEFSADEYPPAMEAIEAAVEAWFAELGPHGLGAFRCVQLGRADQEAACAEAAIADGIASGTPWDLVDPYVVAILRARGALPDQTGDAQAHR